MNIFFYPAWELINAFLKGMTPEQWANFLEKKEWILRGHDLVKSRRKENEFPAFQPPAQVKRQVSSWSF